jgi:hypothetical protein
MDQGARGPSEFTHQGAAITLRLGTHDLGTEFLRAGAIAITQWSFSVFSWLSTEINLSFYCLDEGYGAMQQIYGSFI